MCFRHVIADWPWRYSNRLTGKGRTVFGSGASGKYRTEPIEAIHDMHIADLLADWALVFFWTTGPFLQDTFYLVEALELRYITVAFAWFKIQAPKPIQKMIHQLYSWGLLDFLRKYFRRLPGHYTASNVELVLLAAKGKPPMPAVKLRKQLIVTPATDEDLGWTPLTEVVIAPPMVHSRKPFDVHKWIDEAYPGEPCIELFARPPTHEGTNPWTFLGNEIDGRLLQDSIPALVKERMERQ